MKHTRTVLGNDTANGRRLNTIDDVVAGTRHKVSVAENLNIALKKDIVLSTGLMWRSGQIATVHFPKTL
jgi:hypothetical protein